VGKNTLHEYMAQLEDTFLVRILSLHLGLAPAQAATTQTYPVATGHRLAFGRLASLKTHGAGRLSPAPKVMRTEDTLICPVFFTSPQNW
jgi:hypothetical protein